MREVEDMGPRAALAIAVAVALAGCDGNANSNGGGDMGIYPTTDLAAVHCAVITIVATDGMGNATTSVPATLDASVNVVGVSGAHWSVQHDGDPAVALQPDSTGTRVQYTAELPGSWTFAVSFDHGPCPGTSFVNLTNAQAMQVDYRFRVLPPESTSIPLKDFKVTVSGGANKMQDLHLVAGNDTPGTLEVAGAPAPGEVRFISDDHGPDAVAFANATTGLFTAVLGDGTYRPLLIPTATAPAIPRAPHLGMSQDSSALRNAVFDIPGGVAVSGSVVDNTAAAIGGARVVMRTGDLPSGPGTSDGTGAFTLYAEPATYTMSFGATDWPEGSVDGVVVPAGGTSASVAYTIARVPVGGSVTGDSVSGARVTITSHDAIANVADVTIGGGAPVHAGGRVARVLFTHADGSLPPLQLPAGAYDVIVEPPGPSMNGLTAFSLMVTAPGPTTWTLPLAPPVSLAVTVTGPGGAAVKNARLTAIETVGLGAAPNCTTDLNGKCTLTVDKGAPLSLLVEPSGLDKISGTRLSVPAGGGALSVPLGPGIQVTGVVLSPSNTPVAGVRVEALCWSCGSPTPLATALSDANGVYRIYLPDPGLGGLDGGVTD